ncbi:beta-galactosidase [Duganella sp. CF517]|uniref:beta-galactosidase GalB n=1 Tax=Duganella sp. CF517 TaxID=1881038 RepID=UPI0008C6D536|nr:beta-galactosidase GalB [Duganella sp. CF517]SEN93458.1 beta-galactosidase [Duganella sp. CF517]
MRYLRYLLMLAAVAFSLNAPAHADERAVRERISFNADWRFIKGEPPGAGGDAAFDDSRWRKLDLPHDFGIEGPFKQEYAGETGKLPWWGVAWYRKHFAAPASDAGRRVFIDIDGAMSHATVFLNGQKVGGWPYGYSSFRLELTPYLKPGAQNVLAVRIDNPEESSRWYPGGGIYRNVWLVKTTPLHVANNGIFVLTPTVSADAATVEIRATLDNQGGDAEAKVSTAVYALDAAGRRTGAALAQTAASAAAKIAAGKQAILAQSLQLARPQLWSLRAPKRYVAVTTVTAKDQVVDVVETPFGVRTIAFDAARGFLLNGERVMLQGVSQHHDLGALGAALNVRALERQFEILQEMGVNAIRTTHNPPAPELLELADRRGMLIIVEAFDAWRIPKTKNDYATLYDAWHEKDLRAMVQRDRNHPSVIAWSIGNEIMEQGQPEGWKVAVHLADIVRSEDRSRPTTAGFNKINSGYDGFQTAIDVFGYNYKPAEYGRLHQSAPHLPLYGSETSSTVSSRGEYFFPVSDDKTKGAFNFQVSSYDLTAPPWAWSPDVEFAGIDNNPFVAGEFVWTGFDYLGEPTPYNDDATNVFNFTDPAAQQQAARELAELRKIKMPSRSSYFGIVDLAGFKKDRFYLYQARWRPELPMAHLLPHWNWPERVGQVTPVHLYTSGDEAELFLDGQSLGRKKRGPRDYRLRWDDVVYKPGTLKAVVYKQGKQWAEDTVRTTGAAAKLTLAADRDALSADGKDLSFVTLTIADKDGLAVPRSHNKVKFTVTGPAELVATDNGDATSHVSFQSPERPAFNGLALAIVRAKAGQGGKIVVTATSDGLASAKVELRSKP